MPGNSLDPGSLPTRSRSSRRSALPGNGNLQLAPSLSGILPLTSPALLILP